MAIITCPKCGTKHSDRAPQCPGCSKEKTKQATISPGRIIGGVAAILVLFFILAKGQPEPAKEPAPIPVPFIAYEMSKNFTKDRLRAPATAQFPSFSEATVKEVGPGEFIVISYVDSQNGFGAILRSNFACRLSTIDGGAHWNLVEHAFSND